MILSYKPDYWDGFICKELLLMDVPSGPAAGFDLFEP